MDTMHHLNALQHRLSNERLALANATTEQEKKLRKVWIAQLEKEIALEYQFLADPSQPLPPMTDEELLRQLEA